MGENLFVPLKFSRVSRQLVFHLWLICFINFSAVILDFLLLNLVTRFFDAVFTFLVFSVTLFYDYIR